MVNRKKLEAGLLFLTLIFLPTQLGKHFWPEFSYVFSLKVDYLSPTLYFWDLLVLALLLSWLFNKPKVNWQALIVLVIFLLTQAISIVWSQGYGVGLVRLEQYLISGIFGVYLASQDFLKLKLKLILPLTLGIIFESLLGIWQFIFGRTLGLWFLGERSFSIATPGIAKFDYYGYEFLRPYATFPHPNVLAAFLLITTILTQLADLARFKFFKIFSLFISGIAIFLTVSRVGFILGVSVLVYFLSNRFLKYLLVILLILSPIIYTRFASVFNFDSLTWLRREELSESAWLIFLQNLIIGVGLNNYIPLGAEGLVAGPNRFLQPVHNIYLLSLVETGLVGFLGFLFLIGSAIKNLTINRLKDKDQRILLLCWLVILFAGVFDHFILTLPQGYRLLFLIWGLAFSYQAANLARKN